jgi:prolyl-tRNA synthetase
MAVTPQSQDFSKWYNEIVYQADLVAQSEVRGSMIIKPYGYELWEAVKGGLDRRFKETGHQNAYFPLFIPMSYLQKEAEHVEGFSPELAVVTHAGGKELEEPLVVRPTSETVIMEAFSNWIQSYRDLPILVNQWANVVRWEMRTRLFLRTAEFLWQEGHTAHANREEAIEETLKILNIYTSFAENYMGVPVLRGIKTESERFAGAVDTYCIEALMQDGKALQAGTSHFLGQNFAKAFDVKFATQDGGLDLVWGTSWGVSTRLVGGLIMAHSDDAGLVLPPKLAPIQVVIIPIVRDKAHYAQMDEHVLPIISQMKQRGISVHYDKRDTHKPGWKFAEYELKGVPVRLAIGPRDIENNTVEVARRDTLTKISVSMENIVEVVDGLLEEIQSNLFEKALAFRKEKTTKVDSYDEFKEVLEQKGGFVVAHWDGSAETEERIKNETKATIRCILLDEAPKPGNCVYSGKPSKGRVVFAKAY